MIEKTILDYLDDRLDVPVYMERPEGDIGSLVVLEKTGSSVFNHVTSATFAVQSYAASLYDAAILNEDVKNAMDDLISLAEISSSKLNSDYNFTDTSTKDYRYQAVYDIVYNEI